MFRSARIWLIAIATGAALFLSPTIASANWITIKNDTGKALVVQETVVVRGQVKRGKATNLLPGETLREFIPAPTTKRVEVYDSRSPDRPVWSGDLKCQDATQAFSIISSSGKLIVSPLPASKK
jgi:hypothetical protein